MLIDERVKYVVDAYTTTPYYPYAQQVDASDVDATSSGSFNYIRNSVKAVVDAYDGTVTLYLTDELFGEPDPIIRAYQQAFPGMFTEEIPENVAAALPVPRVHVQDPDLHVGSLPPGRAVDLLQQLGPVDRGAAPLRRRRRRCCARATTASASTEDPIEPYYQEMKIGSAERSEFVLTRPFVLASSDDSGRNLTSVMIARNDPGSFGKLEEIVMVTVDGDEVTRNNTVDGPVQANRKMVTYDPVAVYQTQVGRNGSRVRFGNILILPIRDALVYLRPVYAAEEGSSRFTLKKVVVASGVRVGFGDTVQLAMADLLDADPDGAVDRSPTDESTDEGTDDGSDEGTTTTVPAGDRSPTELLAEADQLFTEAEQRLADGDLAGYDELVTRAVALVRQANTQLTAGLRRSTTTTTTTAPEG